MVRELREAIEILSREPGYNQKKQKKFLGWIRDLDKILAQIASIDDRFIQRIGSDLDCSFSNRNHVLVALMQPSVKKRLEEIQDEFRSESSIIFSETGLGILVRAPEIARSLAWAGDTVIKSAILKTIWGPEKPVEKLNDEREDLEGNKRLSSLCDHWELFEHRLNLDPTDEKDSRLAEIKGSLAEAIIGVIYLEYGMAAAERAYRRVMKY